jgi:hypothetical protein
MYPHVTLNVSWQMERSGKWFSQKATVPIAYCTGAGLFEISQYKRNPFKQVHPKQGYNRQLLEHKSQTFLAIAAGHSKNR